MRLSSGKQIAHNTVYLYCRMILTMLVSLYTVRVILIILGVEDYGIYNAIGGVVASLSFFTQVLANASQRFFSIEMGKGSTGKIQEYFSSLLFAYIIIILLVFLVVETIGLWLINNKMTLPVDRINVATIVFHISLLTFIVSVLGTPFNALIIASEEMNAFAYISIFEVVAKLAVVYLLICSPIDKLIAYALLLLLVSSITSLLYVYISKKKTRFKFRLICNKECIKDIFSYSVWTLVGTISGVLGIQGYIIILNIYCGPIANAAFAISLQISNAVQNFASGFYTAVRPPLTKSYAAGNSEYMMKLFYFSNKTMFVLMFAIIMPLMVETEFVLTLWLSKTTAYMITFVRIMLLYAIVISLNNPITTIIQAAGKVKIYHGVVDGLAILILPVGYSILESGYSPSYALLSMVFVFLIVHVFRLIILSRIIEFSIYNYFSKFIMPCAITSVICYSCIHYIKFLQTSSLFNTLFNIFFSIIMVIICSILILFSNDERNRFIELIKKK